jgi:hypothetical protein
MHVRHLSKFSLFLAFLALAAQAQISQPDLVPKQVLFPSESDISGERHWNFGSVIDFDGRTIAVGLGAFGPGAGAVALYRRSATGLWSRSAMLSPADSQPTDYFGIGVAIDGGVALVQKEQHTLYVFERRRGAWVERQKITLGEFEFMPTGGNHRLDLANGTAVVSSFVFSPPREEPINQTIVFERRKNGTFRRVATLRTNTEAFGNGHTVALDRSGERLLIGNPDEQDPQGAAYIFERHGGRWLERQKLIAIGGGPSDFFGGGVALDGRFAVIGSTGVVHPDIRGNGIGYVFVRRGNIWQQQYTLRPTPEESPQRFLGGFGLSVAMTNHEFLVSAPFDSPDQPGVVFVFERDPNQRVLLARAIDSNGLGYGLSARGSTVVAGVHDGHRGGYINIYDLPRGSSMTR